jgi:hypothetical protein
LYLKAKITPPPLDKVGQVLTERNVFYVVNYKTPIAMLYLELKSEVDGAYSYRQLLSKTNSS